MSNQIMITFKIMQVFILIHKEFNWIVFVFDAWDWAIIKLNNLITGLPKVV